MEKVEHIMHRKFRGWSWCSNHENIDGSRILIIWNSVLVNSVPLEITSQVIHWKVVDRTTSKSFICNFVYGLHNIPRRRDLWSSLLNWGMSNNQPWIVLGDFNSILWLEDRQGGVTHSTAKIEDFLSCTISLGLEDVYSVGSHYTWTNRTVWTKLDRALINLEWHSQNPNCVVYFLHFNTLSDHTPMVDTLQLQNHIRNRSFKFLNMWMSHHSFISVMREIWQSLVYGTNKSFYV